MCLAVPMRIAKIEGDTGELAEAGVIREVSLVLLPEAKIGDYVLVHAGFAIRLVDEDEAQKTLDLIKEISALAAQDEEQAR